MPPPIFVTAHPDEYILLWRFALASHSMTTSFLVLASASEPFPDDINVHTEALLLACSQHYEYEEEEQASKRMKLDTTSRSSFKT